jgi:hypothetical protein
VSEPTDIDGVDIRAAVGVADGSLSGEQRADAEARLQASAAGRRALEQQQVVLRALRAGGPVPSPALRATLAERSARSARARYRWLHRPVLVVGALAAALAVAVVLVGGPGSQPSAAAAIELGTRPATAPAPAPVAARPTLLERSVDGVPFPNWAHARDIAPAGMPHTGWPAVGARRDRLDGRQADTVFYQHMNHRVAYTIIAGGALDPPAGARKITVAGRPLWTLRDGHRDVVVFTRNGHTCVVAGNVISRHTLERLATWPADGSITF